MDLRERPLDDAPRHPWERARAGFFGEVVRRHGLGPQRRTPATLLDVGAGDGWFATTLAARTPDLDVVCWDPGYDDPAVDAAALARAAGDRIRFTPDAPAGRFEAITLLDVLEHVEDDGEFLARVLAEHAAPGALVVVSVPSWPALYTRHDARLRHHRRYTPTSARRLLEGAGLEVLSSGGLFAALLPIRGLGKLLEVARGVDAPSLDRHGLAPPAPLRWNGPGVVGAVLEGVLRADGAFHAALGRAPFSVPGLSWWAACRVPGGH